ncbi:hypothetical protein LAZ67_1003915 [Cordylochernes scorpioides]|uniref:Uncharacterized protein n=1 Tax=Cordylochernes scorpioides TaxID=51811 RepID=A0ABY6K075_9ARAC|nr:hypothetical protein LAZ67_1003915 [Cordylochernes scorpioides]
MKGKHWETVESIQHHVTTFLRSISVEEFQGAFQALQTRLRKCIDAGGMHLLQPDKVFLEKDPHDQYVVSTKVLMAKSKDIRQFLADRDYTTNKLHNWISSVQYLYPSRATSIILELALLSPLCQYECHARDLRCLFSTLQELSLCSPTASNLCELKSH